MKAIALLLLAILTAPALAQDTGTSADGSVPVAKLSWEAPQTRVDGAPLDPVSELAGYTLTCSSGPDERSTPIPATAAGSTYSVTKADILPGYGVHDCYLTVTDTDGRESAPSETVQIARAKTAPMAPTNLLLILE